MEKVDWAINKCREDFLQIKQRKDITGDQKIKQLITITSCRCVAIIAQPIPFADIFILTPIQIYMGSRIAKARGMIEPKKNVSQVIMKIIGISSLSLSTQELVVALYKFIPYWGRETTLPTAFGVTFAMGTALDAYYAKKSSGQEVDYEELKNIFSEAIKKGIKKGKKSSIELEVEKSIQDLEKESISSKKIDLLGFDFDGLLIYKSLLSIRKGAELTKNDEIVLVIFIRNSKEIYDLDSTIEYLKSMSKDRLKQIASDVKKIIHEIKLVNYKDIDDAEIASRFFTGGRERTSIQTNNKAQTEPASQSKDLPLEQKHVIIEENQSGISYEGLFSRYLQGAKHIIITDPYINLLHQVRNVMEFLEMVIRGKDENDEIKVSLITTKDREKSEEQFAWLDKIQDAMITADIEFEYSFRSRSSLHARHITTDTNWRIVLDRGLDIFQYYDMFDILLLANRVQEQRTCKLSEVTYIKDKE